MKHFADAGEGPAQDVGQGALLIGKGKEEIHAADLRVAQMVARFVPLPVVPLDLVILEVVAGALPDAREEVLLSLLKG
jgi:hypothetical protein